MKKYSIIPRAPLTRGSPLDGSMSYPGHTLWEPYTFEKVLSVHSTAQTDWAVSIIVTNLKIKEIFTLLLRVKQKGTVDRS